ncbi:cardiolipin synthase [Synechococcales cyanobacterium C]|uniref:Cardiolipin synthase n=1 Tax=Petrachloros mirabilis ULC683 TaxID=2781853 RepID=A0A8K1ZWW1_9CYAN|nr:cardiolipin synthase [Petrachloros mirabilis]NCJ05531.1 cardiolipin synthase [Petrachloros mirabilis ULC683]
MFFSPEGLTLVSVIVFIVHSLGVFNAAHAVMTVRSSQSAIAWGLSLITFPWITLPLYWVLGRREFQGYTEAYRRAYTQYQDLAHHAYDAIVAHRVNLPPKLNPLQQLASGLSDLPFTSGNAVRLLIDGDATYTAMLAAIRSARHYILLQSYIINNDETGQTFQQALIQQAQQGIRIYVIYDEIGSQRLRPAFIRTLRRHGVQITAFKATRGWRNHLQLNFRNHRKILVVDGTLGFVGGLNIGDEYLGRSSRFGPWRDTHTQLQGPAVLCLQLSFLKDWYWATRAIPETHWQAHPAPANQTVLVFPTGSSDPLPSCTLFFGTLIALAQKRLWIASPYFVPDEATLAALKIAALRGVDVRILLPNEADHLLVYLSSFSYYTEMENAGIQLYRYKTGFMHQKVILVDDWVAGVGTVNLDNRSFHLNFEVSTFVLDVSFISQVEIMFENDWTAAVQVDLSEYVRRPFWFRLAVRVARLLAPLQ